MYDFHYIFIKKKFDVDLLFTDTDSLTYEIKSKDVYQEFFKYCIVSENGEEVNTALIEFKVYKNILFKIQNEKKSKQTTYNWCI